MHDGNKCENGNVKFNCGIIGYRGYACIAGYFIGFLVKKILGLALTIGAFTFLFMYLMHTDTIDLGF